MEIKIQAPQNLNQTNKKIRETENKIYDLAHQNPKKELQDIWENLFENGLSSKKLIVEKTLQDLLDQREGIEKNDLKHIYRHLKDNPVIKKGLGKTRFGDKDRQATYFEPNEKRFWEILHLTRGELLKYVSNYNQKKTKLRKFINAYEENKITLKMLHNEPVELNAEVKIDNKQVLLPQGNPRHDFPDFEQKTATKVAFSNKHKPYHSFSDPKIKHEPNIRLYTKESQAKKKQGEADFGFREVETEKVNFIVCHQLLDEITQASQKYINKLKARKKEETNKIKNIKSELRDYLMLQKLK